MLDCEDEIFCLLSKFSESKADQKTKLGELVKSGIAREGVDSPANQSSGISSFNSDHVQLQNTQVYRYKKKKLSHCKC